MGRYATRKNYPLASVSVRTGFDVGFEKIEGPIHSLAFLASVRCEVDIEGALEQHQYDELKFVAENCLLSNTLRRGVELEQEVRWVRD